MTIWNLLFYVDLKDFLKMKLIHVTTHYYWSIPFSAVNSVFFFKFLTWIPHICSSGTNYTIFENTAI